MKKIILLCIPLFFSAQNKPDHPAYPFDQYAYLGGADGFFTDFHNVLLKEKLQPCVNKSEIFIAKVLIDAKGNAQLINEFKPMNDSPKTFWNNQMYENKCTIELTKKVLSQLELWKWVPAKVNGKEITSIEKFIIYPDNLFSANYLEDGFEAAQYKNLNISDKSFKDQVDRNLDTSDFKTSKPGKIYVGASFTITIDGKMEDLKIIESSGSDTFDERFLYAIKKLKKGWTPAKMHHIPIDQTVRFLFATKY